MMVLIVQKGFSLIELAIVILIIGLITAGISSGVSLSKQTELKTVIAEIQQYHRAFNSFFERYKQYPGDISNSTDYWTSGCADTITCNGDGSNIIDTIWNDSADETGRAWIHLTLAELIQHGTNELPSTYTGVLEIGMYAPQSKIDSAGYYITGSDDIGGDTSLTTVTSPWIGEEINSLYLGRRGLNTASSGLVYGALTGKSSFSIDEKIDDGSYNTLGEPVGYDTGKIRAINGVDGSTDCIDTVNSKYDISTKSESCVLGFQLHGR